MSHCSMLRSLETGSFLCYSMFLVGLGDRYSGCALFNGELWALKDADRSFMSKFKALESDVFIKRSGALFSSTRQINSDQLRLLVLD